MAILAVSLPQPQSPLLKAHSVQELQVQPSSPPNRNERILARRREIVELLSSRGFVPIDELVKQFGMTAQTIRSDVNHLCKEGLLTRYHGGVGLASTIDNATFLKRRVLRHQQKMRIGAAVSQQIPNHCSLMLHYGTTMEAVAGALKNHSGLLLATNNISVAAQPWPAEVGDLILLGGQVRVSELCTQGAATVTAIEQFQFDFGLMSVGAIDDSGVLYEYSPEVAETARAILRNSHRVFLAVDHQKFGRKGLVRIGKLSDVSAIFTDRPLPESVGRLAATGNVAVHVA